jgi:hypothetical protein
LRFQPDEFGMPPKNLNTDRMKRAEPRHSLYGAADEMANALLHLSRGLVGERHGEDL